MATANFCLTVALAEGLKGEDTSLVLFGVGIYVLLLALAFFSRQAIVTALILKIIPILRLFGRGAENSLCDVLRACPGWLAASRNGRETAFLLGIGVPRGFDSLSLQPH